MPDRPVSVLRPTPCPYCGAAYPMHHPDDCPDHPEETR